MERREIRRQRWLALSAGFVFVFGAGVLIGHTGFRVDAGALGNVFGLTPHQWGILTSGLIGSIAGGAVAVWVLLRGLDHQEKLHAKQLAVQRLEATRQRAVAAAAATISGLWLINRASKGSMVALEEQLDAVILGVHSLRLEVEHDRLASALSQVVAEINAEDVIGYEPARKELLVITAAASKAITDWFQSDEPENRKTALRSLQEAKKKAIGLGTL